MLSNLVGGQGCYAVSPAGTYVWGGCYEPGSLIWRSRWTTTDGRIESRQALSVPSDPRMLTLLRRVENVDGSHAHIDVQLDLHTRFGADPSEIHSDGHGAGPFGGRGTGSWVGWRVLSRWCHRGGRSREGGARRTGAAPRRPTVSRCPRQPNPVADNLG